MDIVGLLRNSVGTKYTLIVCDYAIQYTEAFPLKKIKARQSVNFLIQLFSRVSIPKEIFTYHSTNFTSSFLKEVYSVLGIRGTKISSHHPKTDGLVERFNKTHKSMLRKFMNDSGWVAFWPMDILKEAWEGPMPQQKCSMLLFVLKKRDKLDQLQELANENLV